MLNSDQIIEIGEARRAHLRQEAQRDRLIKEARGVRPKRSKQFLKWRGWIKDPKSNGWNLPGGKMRADKVM